MVADGAASGVTTQRGLVPVLALLAAGPTAVAASLAVAKLLAPSTRRGIELVAFTPLRLPAAVLGALAALVLVRHRRLTGRSLVALAVACAGLHTGWLAPRFAARCPRRPQAHPGWW